MIRRFKSREVREALAWSAAGGQALHHIRGRVGVPGIKGATRAAHLFDRDLVRLIRTARSLGLACPKIHRLGGEGQHVDLWAAPLAQAEVLCEKQAMRHRKAAQARARKRFIEGTAILDGER